MREIRVPQLNSNDVTYTLLTWLAGDGAEVRAHQPIAEIETSKSVEVIESSHAGVLHHIVAEAADFAVDEAIAYHFDTAEERAARTAGGSAPAARSLDFVITNSARELVEKAGVPQHALAALGRKIIRRSDVAELLSDGEAPAPPTRLSRAQRQIAEVVSLAHRTIPAAFTVVRVHLDAAEDLRQRLGERGLAIGLPELVVKAIGEAHAAFPAFFATLTGEHTLSLSEAAHVGVTIDTGDGLYVPVVRDANSASLADIAARLMQLRVKAMRKSFQQRDFEGSTIAVSINTDADAEVVFAQPIVHPGHICMVSLGSPMSEVALSEGELRQRRFVHLGIAFDHRVVNGRDAVGFLKSIKNNLETPGSLAGPETSAKD
ncbi:2-oxo acid dehydrogenase subunit E2 [Amycolatopsis sp. NPDC003676]